MAHSAQPSARWKGTGGGAVRAIVEALAFGCELAMLVVLGVAGWSLGSGGLISIAFTVFYPALAILIWGTWMAPKATWRLRDPWRLVDQLILFAATATLTAAVGHTLLGVVFGAVACVVFIGTRFTGGITGADAVASLPAPGPDQSSGPAE